MNKETEAMLDIAAYYKKQYNDAFCVKDIDTSKLKVMRECYSLAMQLYVKCTGCTWLQANDDLQEYIEKMEVKA